MKNKKPCVFIKHIHSGFSSFQTGDRWIYFETTKNKIDFSTYPETIIPVNTKLPILVLETIEEITETNSTLLIHLKSDKKFYDRAMDRGRMSSSINRRDATKEEVTELVKSYTTKGWTEDTPKIYKVVQEQRKIIEEMHRESIGFVFPAYKKDVPIEEYKGGLSDKLFKQPYLKSYIKNGGAFGYIGSYSRTYKGDTAFEKVLIEAGYSVLEIAMYMCGRDGRHFADQLGDFNVNNDIEYINDNLPSSMEAAMSWIKPAVKEYKEKTYKEKKQKENKSV